MVKVAVNRCFGGFELSAKALERYLELNGKECHFYKQIKYKHSDGKDEYKKLTLEEAKDDSSFIQILLKDIGEIVNKIPNNVYWSKSFYNKKRTDKILIQVIEELGKEASGQYADIEVVEIPDGVKWEIDGYDGSELIREVSRTW